jgi:hypothetical protein
VLTVSSRRDAAQIRKGDHPRPRAMEGTPRDPTKARRDRVRATQVPHGAARPEQRKCGRLQQQEARSPRLDVLGWFPFVAGTRVHETRPGVVSLSSLSEVAPRRISRRCWPRDQRMRLMKHDVNLGRAVFWDVRISVLRHLHESAPSHDDVGGLSSEFEPLRTS